MEVDKSSNMQLDQISQGSAELLDAAIKSDTTKKEGIYVILKVSSISPKLTCWQLQPIEMRKKHVMKSSSTRPF